MRALLLIDTARAGKCGQYMRAWTAATLRGVREEESQGRVLLEMRGLHLS